MEHKKGGKSSVVEEKKHNKKATKPQKHEEQEEDEVDQRQHTHQHHIANTKSAKAKPPVRAEEDGGDDALSQEEDDEQTHTSNSKSVKSSSSSSSSKTSKLSDAQKKLQDLKAKLDASRKQNRKEVANEYQRVADPKAAKAKEKEKEKANDKQDPEKDKTKDPDSYYLYETAEAVTLSDERKASKKPAAFGWDVYNAHAQYNAFEKRLKHIKKLPEEANKAESYRDVNSLDFANPQTTEADVDRMVAELDATQQRRAQYSRRRAHNEGADVDYISEKNRVFNKKIKRAFDSYTTEIRNNLERGTAL